jgi:hypothetical protein
MKRMGMWCVDVRMITVRLFSSSLKTTAFAFRPLPGASSVKTVGSPFLHQAPVGRAGLRNDVAQ